MSPRLELDIATIIDKAMRDELERRRPKLGPLVDVFEERRRQDAKWGEQNHPDGTATFPAAARREADEARRECQALAAHGACTWRAILAEEVAEAFAESDPDALRRELIQVAAVAVQWAQAIDRREPAPKSEPQP